MLWTKELSPLNKRAVTGILYKYRRSISNNSEFCLKETQRIFHKLTETGEIHSQKCGLPKYFFRKSIAISSSAMLMFLRHLRNLTSFNRRALILSPCPNDAIYWFLSFPLLRRLAYFYKNAATMSPLTQEKVYLEIIAQKNFYKK